MKYVLAIDGGGTKTLVWAADETGQVLGEGQSGPASLVVSPPEVAVANVQAAIEQAVSHLPSDHQLSLAFMGLAGVDIPLEIDQAHHIFESMFREFGISQFEIVNDVEIALASGISGSDGVALISGTGSNCFGKNQQGQKARSSGLDYILADQGSGYSLGLATLQAAVKSYDGRLPKSILEELVCQYFQVSAIPELKLKVYHPPLSKTQVAELAKVTEKALDQGDLLATRLFDELVLDLVSMVSAVLRQLQLTESQVECVVVGGMMRVPYVYDSLKKALTHRYSYLTLLKPTKPPVAGALRLALEKFSR